MRRTYESEIDPSMSFGQPGKFGEIVYPKYGRPPIEPSQAARAMHLRAYGQRHHETDECEDCKEYNIPCIACYIAYWSYNIGGHGGKTLLEIATEKLAAPARIHRRQ